MSKDLDKTALALLEQVNVRMQRPVEHRATFQKNLASFLKNQELWLDSHKFETASMDTRDTRSLLLMQAAQDVMGASMLHFADVEERLCVRFTAEERQRLAIIPWTAEELAVCKDTHVLYPGYPVTLLELRAKSRRIFRRNTDFWYEVAQFAYDERAELCWHLVCRGQKKAAENEHVPTAATLALGVVLFWKASGVELLKNEGSCFGTSSEVHGRRVYLNHYEESLDVRYWEAGFGYDERELAVARNHPH